MAGGGEAEKRSNTAVFPRRRRAPVVDGDLVVLLWDEGSRGMRRGQRRRMAMTESVSSLWRGESVATASVSDGGALVSCGGR
jgi:hypothetical protein